MMHKLFLCRHKNEQFAGRGQHDAQELLNYLLTRSALPLTCRKRRASSPSEEEPPNKASKGEEAAQVCKNIPQDSAGYSMSQTPSVAALFQGKLAFVTRCFDCDNCTRRTEPFLHVSVPVTHPGLPGFPSVPEHSECSDNSSAAPVSLSWCLSKLMCQERLAWSNKFWCDSCRHLVEAERSILFSSLPEIMTVHLNRFSIQDWGRAVCKVAGSVAVPLSLCLSAWSTRDCASRNSMYYLQAVVLHSGASCLSGHYTTVVRAAERWLLCDDETVHQLHDTAISKLLSPFSSSSASPYILFYHRLSKC